MNRALFFLLLSVLLIGSSVAVKGGQSLSLRRMQDDEDEEAGAEPKAPKEKKEPKCKKDKKDKKDPKAAKEKDTKAPKAAKAGEKTKSPTAAPTAAPTEAGLPYCEDLSTCEQIGAGVTPESEDKVKGKLSLRVAHSESDQSDMVYKVTDILQYRTSAKLAGCKEGPEDNGLEGPDGNDVVVAKAEDSEGFRLLGANFTNAKAGKSEDGCKKKNLENCDSLTTDVEISYESLDGKSATNDEKERMMEVLRQVVEEQENAGVFDTVSASVEAVDTDFVLSGNSFTSPGTSATITRGVSSAVMAGVALAGAFLFVEAASF